MIKTKLQVATEKLEAAKGDVSAAKKAAAASFIKARTWDKAIQLYWQKLDGGAR